MQNKSQAKLENPKMSSEVKYACFKCLVYWEKAKRWIGYFNHNLSCWWIDQDEETKRRLQKWGNSAPSLLTAPQSLARPLSQRIIKDTAFSNDLEKIASGEDDFTDMTFALKQIMDHKENNTLDRQDVFHCILKDRIGLPKGSTLLVEYKNGMRTHFVTYKEEMVFPPSVTQAPSTTPLVTLPNYDIILTTAEKIKSNVTKLFQQFSGPAQDFYCGSTYETTIRDLYNYLKSKGIETIPTGPYHYDIYISRNAQEHPFIISVPATSNESICLILQCLDPEESSVRLEI